MARGVGGEGGARGGRDPMGGGGMGGGAMGGGTGGRKFDGFSSDPSFWMNQRPHVFQSIQNNPNGMLANIMRQIKPGMFQAATATAAPPPAPAPQAQFLSQHMVPGGSLSVPGGSPYGVNLPSYSYFGTPGQRRPAFGGF
jgi:hypothetical protein